MKLDTLAVRHPGALDLSATPGACSRHDLLVRGSFYAVVECAKPIGAGYGPVMAADIWLLSEDAYVSTPEINVGLGGGITSCRKSSARRGRPSAARLPRGCHARGEIRAVDPAMAGRMLPNAGPTPRRSAPTSRRGKTVIQTCVPASQRAATSFEMAQ